MKLQNSYIFLRNPNKARAKKKEQESNNVIRIDVPSSVFSHISKLFPEAVDQSNDSDVWNYQKKLMWEYTADNANCAVEFHFYEVVETTYLDVLVEGKNKKQIINCLEIIQSAFQRSDIPSEFIMIISYDAISEYYCNKIYPRLNELERNLRRLLFNIYIVNFGKEYYKATISSQLQNKGKGVIQAKGNAEQKEIARLQEFFYSLEFNDIQEMLFTPHWTDFDEQTIETFLSKNKDLTVLSDKTLRDAFLNFVPKSDWERFFSDKISEIDFKNVFDSIRKYRNLIAHCKFFYKESYRECCTSVKQLNEAILVAIKKTEEKDFAEKNSEMIRQASQKIKESLDAFLSIHIPSITEKLSKGMQQWFIGGIDWSSTIESMQKATSVALQAIIKPLELSPLHMPQIEELQLNEEENEQAGKEIREVDPQSTFSNEAGVRLEI